MIYILYWSIMWLLSLAFYAKLFNKVTTSDVLFTLITAPATMFIGSIMLFTRATDGKLNKTLWRK